MIDEETIRQRAYELWQKSGEAEGSPEDHWRQAREELEAEQGEHSEMNGSQSSPTSGSAIGAQTDPDPDAEPADSDIPGQQGS
jgi:hypothetical protein